MTDLTLTDKKPDRVKRARDAMRSLKDRPARLTATFRLVTPALIGGADNKAGEAELRPSTVMAGLRFWWRALAWSRLLRALPGGTEAERLRMLHNWQATLFGAASGLKRRNDPDRDYGCGRVSARLTGVEGLASRAARAPDWGYDRTGYDAKVKEAEKAGLGLTY